MNILGAWSAQNRYQLPQNTSLNKEAIYRKDALVI